MLSKDEIKKEMFKLKVEIKALEESESIMCGGAYIKEKFMVASNMLWEYKQILKELKK